MLALCTTPDGPQLCERPSPQPPPGWVRLRVAMAGVCRTDIDAARGHLEVESGRVLGHELAGFTEDGVLVSVRPRLQDRRFLGVDLDGGFAEEVVVPARALVPLASDMDLRRAAFVEPAAAALSVLDAVSKTSGRVAVRGHGRIAELCRRVLKMAGVSLIDDQQGNLDVLVLTGIAGVCDLEPVRDGGLVVLKGRPSAPVLVDQRAIVERGLTLRGVDYGDFAHAAELLASGALPVDDLFATPLPLSRFSEAFAAGEHRKNLLIPGG